MLLWLGKHYSIQEECSFMRIEESTKVVKGINRNAINIGVVFIWTMNTENESN